MAPRSISILLVTLISAVGGAQSITTPTEMPAPSAPDAAAKVATPIQTEEAAKPAAQTERIEVTGSRIKRVDIEGVSPVQTVTRKDIERTGYNAVADVLRDTGVNSFGSTRENSGSNAAGTATVNMRGLGESNTLVLLNGQRLPTDAVLGAVDLNMIPMAAVERVEILKDGASAIYGSDALGGVVNIITRKDFTGNQVSYNQSLPENPGGKKQDISLVNGVNKGAFNMVNVVQYRDNKVVYSRDRDWTKNGYNEYGFQPSFRNVDDVNDLKWIANKNCPPEMIKHTTAGDECRARFSDYSTELPALQQLSLLSESNYEVNSRVNMKARLGGTDKKVQWSYAPAPGQFNIPKETWTKLNGPDGNPLTSNPDLDPSKDLQIRYRTLGLGTRDHKIETIGYNALLGTTVHVNDTWDAQLNLSHNRTKTEDTVVQGHALKSAIRKAMADGTFNPFDNSGSLEGTRYTPKSHQMTELSSAEVQANGAFGHLKGGPIGIAMGSSFTFQKFQDHSDPRSANKEVFGDVGSIGGGQRDSKAVFTEFSMPLHKKFELQLAGRWDQYSDFGDTVNPKIAFLFHATPNLLWRASAGTGFKAPLMQDLYAAKATGAPTAIDYVKCPTDPDACLPQQYDAENSGNPGLKEERSVSYTTGVVYSPTSDFSLNTDLYLTKLKNVVGLDYSDMLLAEKEKGIDYVRSFGVDVVRDPGGHIDHIVAPQQNLSSKDVGGIDLGGSYKYRRLVFGVNHNQVLMYKEEGFPGTGKKNKLGKDSNPPWRNTVSVDYSPFERHSVTTDVSTIAGYEKDVPEKGRLPNFTTVGLMYNYAAKKLGTFTVGVSNLLGTKPPLDDSGDGRTFNNDLYDQIGRQVFTGYKATF